MRLTIAAAVLSIVPAVAAEGSGEPWGARDPLACQALVKPEPPTVDEAKALFRCKREVAVTASDELWLIEDLELAIGKGRPHKGRDELMDLADSDTSAPVYPLRGTWTLVSCRIPSAVAATGGDASRNCSQSAVPQGEGACWLTSFGDWRCDMTSSTQPATPGHPPPQ